MFISCYKKNYTLINFVIFLRRIICLRSLKYVFYYYETIFYYSCIYVFIRTFSKDKSVAMKLSLVCNIFIFITLSFAKKNRISNIASMNVSIFGILITDPFQILIGTIDSYYIYLRMGMVILKKTLFQWSFNLLFKEILISC